MKTQAALLGGDEARGKKPGKTARVMRRNPYAACVVRVGRGNDVFLYINAAIPKGHHPSEGVCPLCKAPDPNGGKTAKVSYAGMINAGKPHCDECEGDRIAAMGIDLERQGIPLGWGAHASSRQTPEYEREAYKLTSRTTHLDSDAREL